jgi:hypothetical protein
MNWKLRHAEEKLWNTYACTIIDSVTEKTRLEARYGKKSLWRTITLYTSDHVLSNMMHALCIIKVINPSQTQSINEIMPSDEHGYPFQSRELKEKASKIIQSFLVKGM